MNYEVIGNKFINICGRYFISDNGLTFDNVASGIEITFKGSKLALNAKTFARPRINPKYPMYTVLRVKIDDSEFFRLDITNEDYQEITICKNLSEGTHNVLIYKTDDPLISSFYIKNIITDGTLLDAPKKKYKMEIYGDSILSGGDNLIGDGPSLDVVPGTGDGTQTYGVFAANSINASVSVLSRCGLCLYPASSFDTEVVVSKIYDKVSTQNLVKWDLTNYIPDIVLFGLGTNDELGNQYTHQGFTDAYVELIIKLANLFGKSTLFILSYGYMNKDEKIENAVLEVVKKLLEKDYNIVPLKLPKAKRGHPSVSEHLLGGKLLEELLHKKGF